MTAVLEVKRRLSEIQDRLSGVEDRECRMLDLIHKMIDRQSVLLDRLSKVEDRLSKVEDRELDLNESDRISATAKRVSKIEDALPKIFEFMSNMEVKITNNHSDVKIKSEMEDSGKIKLTEDNLYQTYIYLSSRFKDVHIRLHLNNDICAEEEYIRVDSQIFYPDDWLIINSSNFYRYLDADNVWLNGKQVNWTFDLETVPSIHLH